MKSHSDSVTNISSFLTAIISLIIAFSIPAGYFIVAYQYIGGSINTEITYSARAVERLVVNNPKSWHYEEIRLQEILERRLGHNNLEKWAVRDLRGDIIAQTKEPLTGFVLTFSQPIYDSGEEVARMEIGRSISPLILRTVIVGACSTLLGIMIFLIFRFFPLRTVRKAYQNVEENEQRLTLALKSGHFGVWDWDMKNDTMIWDDRMYEIYGVARDSVTVSAETWQNFIHREDRERVLENIRVKAAGEREYNAEFRIVWPDGTIRYIKANGLVICDKDGKPSRIITLNHDITKRKQVEEALRKSEEYFRAITENASDVIFIVDELGTVKYASPSVEWVVGYRPDELTGRNAFDLILPADLPRAVEDFRQALLARETFIPNSFRVLRKDGSVITLEGVGNNLLHDTVIAGFVMNVRDVTSQKHAEEVLRKSERRYRQLIDQAADGIFVVSSEGDYLLINKKFCEMLGYTEDELLRLNVVDTYPDELKDIGRRNIQRVSTGEAMRFERAMKRKDGTTLQVEVSVSRLDDGRLQGIIHDITKRKLAEEEKEKLQGQLFQSQKMESVGRLAGGVAHDFNNMLGVILGHAELALEKVDPDQRLYNNLQEIKNTANRSADLTRQLLAFARKQTVSPRILDLNESVTGMLKMLQRIIGEDIHLAWLPGINLWPVKIDPSQIDQIMVNLCVNARDAITGVGKVTIETANITFDEGYCADKIGFIPGEYVLLAVSDDGCGMDKEILGMLFEPFFTTKGIGKGTGLGLSTVYGIVKQNDGFINVYSEPDQGTTIRIYLPREWGKAEQARTEGKQEPAMRGHETLLVVEDEPAILDMISLILENQGYRVLTAGTPDEAIRLADEHAGEIHLLMTDVVMPGMNGRDLAKKLLSLYPGLKRLFMSGYTANVIAHRGVLDEGVHFIQKPFSIRDLAAKVREALDDETVNQ